MKKIYTILAMAALMVCGCMETELPYDNNQDGPKVFTASFEEPADTKTYVDENLKLLWNADDRISIFTTTLNEQYSFEGSDGDNSETFTKVSFGQFGTGSSISTNYAVYPYSSSTKLTNEEYITLTLPDVQSYNMESFGIGANTMVAVTSSPSDYFLPFKNLCGYLVVKLYGEGTVKSISIKGNNGEKLAGPATVTATYGAAPMLKMGSDATETITIDCGEGVKLGTSSSAATEFWFCIPPVTFSKGFTVTVTDLDGKTFEKSVSSSRTIARNVINSLSALNVKFSSDAPVPEAVDLGLPSGIKWASFNLGASKPEEYGGYYQWGGTMDVTETSIYLDWNNCPYHPGLSYWAGWTKYIPSGESSYWDGPGSPDNKTVLDPEDDVAHVKLGGKWRMPTKAEWEELGNTSNCTWTWTTVNGIDGYKVTSEKSGYTSNYIFLPAAGYRYDDGLRLVGSLGSYWSSSLDTDNPGSAYSMYVLSGGVYASGCSRYAGLSVRPVSE